MPPARMVRKTLISIGWTLTGQWAASNETWPPFVCRAHLDTATRDFSLSPPAERGERVGERGIDGFADLGGSGFPTGRPPLPSPLLQRRGGGAGRGPGAGAKSAPRPGKPLVFFPNPPNFRFFA